MGIEVSCSYLEQPVDELNLSSNIRAVEACLIGIEGGPKLVAFEVKSGGRPSSVRGLAEFQERFDATTSIIVGEGGVPLSEFLSVPAGEWFERT